MRAVCRNDLISLRKVYTLAGNRRKEVYLLFPSGDPTKNRPKSERLRKHSRKPKSYFGKPTRQPYKQPVFYHGKSSIENFVLGNSLAANVFDSQKELSKAPETPIPTVSLRSKITSGNTFGHWSDACTVTVRKVPLQEKTINSWINVDTAQDFFLSSLKIFNLCALKGGKGYQDVKSLLQQDLKADLMSKSMAVECDWYGGKITRSQISPSFGSRIRLSRKHTVNNLESTPNSSSMRRIQLPFAVSVQHSRWTLSMHFENGDQKPSPEHSLLSDSKSTPEEESSLPTSLFLGASLHSGESFQVNVANGPAPAGMKIDVHHKTNVFKPNLHLPMARFSMNWQPYLQQSNQSRSLMTPSCGKSHRHGTRKPLLTSRPQSLQVKEPHKTETEGQTSSEYFRECFAEYELSEIDDMVESPASKDERKANSVQKDLKSFSYNSNRASKKAEIMFHLSMNL